MEEGLRNCSVCNRAIERESGYAPDVPVCVEIAGSGEYPEIEESRAFLICWICYLRAFGVDVAPLRAVQPGRLAEQFTTPEIEADKQMREWLEDAQKQRDAWKQTAEQEGSNAAFYRDIVREIGELFGDAAKRDDTGTLHQDVLALKVKGCAREMMMQRDNLLRSCRNTVDALDDMRRSRDIFLQERDEARESLEAVRKSCESQRTCFAELSKKLADLTSRHKEARALLEESRKERAQWADACREARDARDSLRAKLDAALSGKGQAFLDLTSQIETQKQLIESLQKELGKERSESASRYDQLVKIWRICQERAPVNDAGEQSVDAGTKAR